MASVGLSHKDHFMPSESGQNAVLELKRVDKELLVSFSGNWLLKAKRPLIQGLVDQLAHSGDLRSLRLNAGNLGEWDSSLLTFVRKCYDHGVEAGVEVHLDGLPEGVRNMMRLSLAVPEFKRESDRDPDRLTRIGNVTLQLLAGLGGYLGFIGQLLLDFGSLLRGRAQIKIKDFLLLLQETGVNALPIVILLNGLTGLIIGFIGVIQLQKFAADIFVADLVGVATTRELGAVITGVIMAGRTGAAFAAQIGSMQVNEEVDALTTFGISPMQFLVLPRLIALVLMMPLLCVIGDVVGVLGGMVIAVTISDVSMLQYFNQVESAVSLADFLIGIFKAGVFGIIIALAGCYRGLTCGRDATAVGMAATSAVVTSITWLVVADALFAVLFHILGL